MCYYGRKEGSRILFALIIYIILSWLTVPKEKKTLKQYESVTLKRRGCSFGFCDSKCGTAR